MIARILLIVVSGLGIWNAIDEIKVSEGPKEPAVLPIQSLAGRNSDEIPRFVRITEGVTGPAVCSKFVKKSEGKSADEESRDWTSVYVALLTPAQMQKVDAGHDVTASVVFEGDKDFVRDCCNGDTCSEAGQRPVQGVTELGWLGNIESGITAKFKEQHVQLGEKTILLTQEPAPTSTGSSIGLLAFFIFLGIVGVVPFFEKKHEELAFNSDGSVRRESLHSRYPSLSVYDDRASSDFETAITRAASQHDEEVVLLKTNCVDWIKRPALAVLTNRRYLIYRTRSQLFGVIGRLIEKAFDAAPGGGIGLTSVRAVSRDVRGSF